MVAVPVDTTFDLEAAAAAPVKVDLAGAQCTLVDDPPVGALIVFTRRLQSKEPQLQMGAILELMERWIIPDDHDALFDAVGGLHLGGELESFMENDIAKLIEAVSARPTLAQSS